MAGKSAVEMSTMSSRTGAWSQMRQSARASRAGAQPRSDIGHRTRSPGHFSARGRGSLVEVGLLLGVGLVRVRRAVEIAHARAVPADEHVDERADQEQGQEEETYVEASHARSVAASAPCRALISRGTKGEVERPEDAMAYRETQPTAIVAAPSNVEMEEFRADPVVQPDPPGHFLHVGADLFREVGNLVDEGILVARKELAAYFVSSAVRRSV